MLSAAVVIGVNPKELDCLGFEREIFLSYNWINTVYIPVQSGQGMFSSLKWNYTHEK